MASIAAAPALSPSRARAASPVRWPDAVEEAARGNADLRAARESLEAARNTAKAAMSGFFPQVSGSFNTSYGSSASSASTTPTTSSTAATTISVPANAATEARTFFNLTIAASQNLFNGLATISAWRQAQANARGSEASYETARAKASYDLKSAFAGMAYAQRYLTLADDIIRRRQENLKIVELRFENGNENKGSFLLSEAYLKEARLGRLQALDALEVARRQLAQVLGRDEPGAEEGLEVAGDVPVSAPADAIDLRQVAAQTPDHLQAVAQEDATESAIGVSRAAFFPSLNVVGSVNRTGTVFFPSDQGWSVGLNLSVPLFNGGRDLYATLSAMRAHEASAANRQSVDRGLLPKLRQALSAYVEAVEKLEVDKAFLDASTVRETIGRSKYNNGLLSFEEWDIIENDFISRQKSALESERARIVAEAAWEQAQGKGVIR